jgi:radical SAM superfamily enzyme YgiQ (UPF0313 family)
MELKFENGDGRAIYLHVRSHVLSLALGATDVLTFDREGRIVTAVLDGRTYRRGLDGRILEKWRETRAGGAVRRRHWLSTVEGHALIDRVHREVGHAHASLSRILRNSQRPAAAEAIARELDRLQSFDSAALERDAQRFSAIYKPISILPPDQYLALVLQITEGCSYNRCTFCSFYRDRPFRVKSLAETESHAAEVVRFLGAGLTLRRSVFLADANALCLPLEKLVPILQWISDRLLPALGTESGGIHSFVDLFSDRLRSPADYAELRSRNVRRVYVGVESGCAPLLKFLKKPQTPEQIVETVRTIKKGGLNVGAILMLGLGGREYSTEHVRETVQVLNSIPWTAGDVVFLSEFVEFPALEYPVLARSAGLHELSADEMAAQYETIAAGIRSGTASPKIAPYNAEEFIY